MACSNCLIYMSPISYIIRPKFLLSMLSSLAEGPRSYLKFFLKLIPSLAILDFHYTQGTSPKSFPLFSTFFLKIAIHIFLLDFKLEFSTSFVPLISPHHFFSLTRFPITFLNINYFQIVWAINNVVLLMKFISLSQNLATLVVPLALGLKRCSNSLACGCFVPIKPTPSKPLIISF